MTLESSNLRITRRSPTRIDIWGSKWSQERVAYNIEHDELENHHPERTVLKENVYPKGIAEAIAYFVSRTSAKTTGCMLQ